MNGPFNPATERYLGGGAAKGVGTGVITGLETATTASGAGTTRQTPNGSSGGLAGLRESISNLSIGRGKGVQANKNLADVEQEMEVEMQ